MDDPFFAEDDGEFDDFYGNGARTTAPKRPSQAAAMLRPSEPRAQVYAPVRSAPSHTYPDTPASSAASFRSRSTDGGLLSVSTVTPRHGATVAAPGAAHAKKRKKPRRRRSQERFEVEWEKDNDVTACFVCASAFSLLKRKHHCRHCGRVICSDCSSFRRFSSSRGKHRVCSYCSVEIANGGGARQTLGGGGARESLSDAEMATPQHQEHRSTMRQSIVGAFSSKSADSRFRAHSGDAPPVSASRRSSSHQTTDKQPTSELFDTSDDFWFGDPVDDENGQKRRNAKPDRHSQPKSVTVTKPRDSYARPQVVRAPDSLFDVQFTNGNQYDDESEHDDRDEFTMPRPTSESETVDRAPPRTSDFLASSRHSTVKRLDAPLTMDDLQPSSASALYVSSARTYETALVVAPPITSRGVDQTFYNDDADHLVVDDAPGYYDSVIHEQSAKPNVTPGYSNPALMPRTSLLAPVSDDSSGTLVEASDVGNVAAQATVSKGVDRSPEDKGFTGALKRFFGISKTKSEAPTKQSAAVNSASSEAATTPALANSPPPPPPPHVVSPSEQQVLPDMPRPTLLAPAKSDHYDDDGVYQPDTDMYDMRHTIASEDKFKTESLYNISEAPLRHTMAGYVVPSSRADSLMRASVVGTTSTATPEPIFQPVVRKKSRNSVRSRRDTFDDLFDAPAASLASSTPARTADKLPAQSWTSPYDGRSTVGVDRFDRPRNEDLDDEITRGLGLPVGQDRSVASQPASSSRTPWSGVSSYRQAADTPMYATPSTYAPGHESVHQHDYDTQYQSVSVAKTDYETDEVFESGRGSEPKRTIMGDLRPNSTAPSSQSASRKDSLDDYFAEFERPTEYVFDTASGTYVSANHRRSTQSATDRVSEINGQSPAVLKTMEVREERLRASTRNSNVLEPVREDTSDEIDGIIADKISTLAGELEALKQLLRQRRVRSSPTSTGASTASRKQSIFDSDGSDGDVNPRPKKPATSKRTASSRKDKEVGDRATQKNRRTRKDSFADLFEDDQEESVEQQGFGTRNYEALFQIGQTTTNAVENSDDEGREKKLSGRARKRGSKVAKQRVNSSSSGTENEPRESQLTTESNLSKLSRTVVSGSAPALWVGEDDTTEPSAVAIQAALPAQMLSKKTAKKDAIDSLFDSDSDQDMGQLYETTAVPQVPTSRRHSNRGEAVASDSEDENQAIVLHQSTLRTDATRSDRAQVAISANPELVYGTQGASSDEEFSSTLKNLRGRRKTPPPAAKAPVSLLSPELSDADNDTNILQSSSLVDQPNDLFQLPFSAEAVSSDDEKVAQITSPPDEFEAQAVTSTGSEDDAIDVYDSSEGHRILTEVEANAEVNILTANDPDIHQERFDAVEVAPGAESWNNSSPSDTARFDPLASLDDEDGVSSTQTGNTASVPATTHPGVESSPWGQDVGAIGERLKALRFRDSLLDDSSTDVFAPSTSLNLDDLFNDSREDPVHLSGSGEEDQNPSSEDEESFSFEVKPKQRSNKPPLSLPTQEEPINTFSQDIDNSTSNSADDREPTKRESELKATIANDEGGEPKDVLSSVAEETSWGSMSIASSTGDVDLARDIDSAQFQDDWQRLQEQEKERKKKLQMKQRQAQREKLKKQSSSGRSLGKSGSSRSFAPSATSPTASGSSKSSRTDKDPVEAAERKKKKKHRKKAEDEIAEDNDVTQLTRKYDKRRHKRQPVPLAGSADENGEQGVSESEGAPPSSSRTDL